MRAVLHGQTLMFHPLRQMYVLSASVSVCAFLPQFIESRKRSKLTYCLVKISARVDSKAVRIVKWSARVQHVLVL